MGDGDAWSAERSRSCHAGASGSGFYEYDAPNGPALNASYKTMLDDTAADQCWHMQTASTDMGCAYMGHTTSDTYESGIETTATSYKMQGEGQTYYRYAGLSGWANWPSPYSTADGAFCSTMPGGSTGVFHVGTAAGLC